jgi:ribonuclease J
MYEVAKENGYLLDVPDFLSDKDVGYLPINKIVMICTGSQGEPRAALSRIADRSHPQVSLEAGDSLIFSSRVIPGNERAIGRIQSKFITQGVKIITEKEAHVHVSGHPGRQDMIKMYQLVKPEISIPVHGESRHLIQHAELARLCQVPQVVIPKNGSAIKLAPGPAEEIGLVSSSNLAVDGSRLNNLNGDIIADRKKLLFNGTVAVTIILDISSLCKVQPILSVVGVYDDNVDDFTKIITEEIFSNINNTSLKNRESDRLVNELVRKIIRRKIKAEYGKKPLVSVHIVRV